MKLKQRREPVSTLRRGIVCEGKYICASVLWSVEDESRDELVKPAPEDHQTERGEGGGEKNQPCSVSEELLFALTSVAFMVSH